MVEKIATNPKEKIGVPTFSGVKQSMLSYAMGLAGGLIYGVSTAVTGSGLIGGLLGAGIAGAAIKGVRGEILSTVLGFQTIVSAMAGAGGNGRNNGAATQRAIM